MARHFRNVIDDRKEPAEKEEERTEVGLTNQYALNDEARDMRNGGRRLAMTEDFEKNPDMVGTMMELKDLIAEQRKLNRDFTLQMKRLTENLREAVEEINDLKAEGADIQRNAMQQALLGVDGIQKQAGETALKNINELTDKTTIYIDRMISEAKKRIERLAMITLPDRLFYTGKWIALMLILIICCHIIWNMMLG